PTFLARGLNWILTDKQIFFAQNEEPYLYSLELKNDFNNLSYINIAEFSLLPAMGSYQLIGSLLIKTNENGTKNLCCVKYLNGIEPLIDETHLLISASQRKTIK
ncbi:MAG: hypothetical protein IJ597_05375, partial [Synergistaceae bacterium]|nr:hypothetical protein [Synergistaceae bacterium]